MAAALTSPGQPGAAPRSGCTPGSALSTTTCFGRERWAVDVKLTASPSPEDMARLNQTADLVGATRRFLVTRTPRSAGTDRQASCDLPWLLSRLPTLD